MEDEKIGLSTDSSRHGIDGAGGTIPDGLDRPSTSRSFLRILYPICVDHGSASVDRCDLDTLLHYKEKAKNTGAGKLQPRRFQGIIDRQHHKDISTPLKHILSLIWLFVDIKPVVFDGFSDIYQVIKSHRFYQVRVSP